MDDTPKSIAEAYASPDVDDWKEAVHDEMDLILSNVTWKLIDRPYGCKPVGCKRVFKKKLKPDGPARQPAGPPCRRGGGGWHGSIGGPTRE